MSNETTTWPEWMDTRKLREYASVSERTLRSWIHRHFDPLPASQAGGKIRVKRSVFDQWMARQEVKGVDVDAIVEEIVSGVTR